MLLCCYKPTCPHPFCRSDYGKDLLVPKWAQHFLYANTNSWPCYRQWGLPHCPNCKGKCYVAPDVAMLSSLKCMVKPHLCLLKKCLKNLMTYQKINFQSSATPSRRSNFLVKTLTNYKRKSKRRSTNSYIAKQLNTSQSAQNSSSIDKMKPSFTAYPPFYILCKVYILSIAYPTVINAVCVSRNLWW